MLRCHCDYPLELCTIRTSHVNFTKRSQIRNRLSNQIGTSVFESGLQLARSDAKKQHVTFSHIL